MSKNLNIPVRSQRPSRIKWIKDNRCLLNLKLKKWRDENREKNKLYMLEYCRKNRVKINQAQKEQRIKRLYGISLQEFELILEAQGGGCAICGKKSKKYRLSIDHDHYTGKIRGILCSPCNRAIGILGDSLEGLLKAVNYLRNHYQII